MRFWNQALSTLHGENNVDVDLGVGICHEGNYLAPSGAIDFWCYRFYRHSAPTEQGQAHCNASLLLL